MKLKIAGAVLAAAIAGALVSGPACAETQTVGVIQLVEHNALDAANRGIVDQMQRARANHAHVRRRMPTC